LDPHGAVAFRALADHLAADNGRRGIILETAHPVKFDSVSGILGRQIERPAAVKELFTRERFSIEIPNEYSDVREIVASRI